MEEGDKWVYRGEGNSSLVVSDEQKRQVLRMRKCSTDGSKNKQEANRRDWVLCKDYIDNVMRPLLGERYVASPELVNLTLNFVNRMNEECFQSRPRKRLNAHADGDVLIGMVLPDVCFLPDAIPSNPNPTFCVELKLKQGFFPPYSLEKSKPHPPVCRFCMLQQLKVRKGTLNHLSKFCPLDIFSGNHIRMKIALCNVLETPQNNIRIFKDGTLIFSCQDGNPSTLADLQELTKELQSLTLENGGVPHLDSMQACLERDPVSIMNDLVVKALLHVPPGATSIHPDDYITEHLCSASIDRSPSEVPEPIGTLPAGCVLHAVLAVQHLDRSGVYSIHEDYVRLVQYLEANPHHREFLTMDGPYPSDFITISRDPTSHHTNGQPETISNHSTRDGFAHSRNHITDISPVGADIPPEINECLGRVRSFLVAGTCKDLSVMIALQRIPDGTRIPTENVLSSSGGDYQHSIKIVDLDPKHSSRILRYIPLEDDIWANYQYGDS